MFTQLTYFIRSISETDYHCVTRKPTNLANRAIYVNYRRILIAISAFVGSRPHIISRIPH
jgi:hypothetical protein